VSLGGGHEGGLPSQARQRQGRQSWGGRHQLPSRGPIIAAIFLELGATRRREITTIMELMLRKRKWATDRGAATTAAAVEFGWRLLASGWRHQLVASCSEPVEGMKICGPGGRVNLQRSWHYLTSPPGGIGSTDLLKFEGANAPSSPRFHRPCFFIAAACLVVLTGLDVTRHDGGPANFNLIKSQRRHSETNYLFCLMILLCQAHRNIQGHGGKSSPPFLAETLTLFKS
jgi:hypothetical protein